MEDPTTQPVLLTTLATGRELARKCPEKQITFQYPLIYVFALKFCFSMTRAGPGEVLLERSIAFLGYLDSQVFPFLPFLPP